MLFRSAEPIVLDDKQPRSLRLRHGLALVRLRLGQLQTKVKEGKWRNHAQAKADSPCHAEMAFRGDQDHNHGHNSRYHETEVNLYVGKQHEPSVASAVMIFGAERPPATETCCSKALKTGIRE